MLTDCAALSLAEWSARPGTAGCNSEMLSCIVTALELQDATVRKAVKLFHK